MPYVPNTNTHFHYADHMTKEDFASLYQGDMATKLYRATEKVWLENVYQNAGQLVQALSQSAQFEEELIALNDPQPDYVEACRQNDIEIVDGTNDTFFFSWKDFSTVDLTSFDDAMIDFRGFADHHKLDLAALRWDSDNEEVVVFDSVQGQHLTTHSNVLEGFLEATMLPNGQDVKEMLIQAAFVAGKPELADFISANSNQKVFGDFVNKDFVSSQTNSDYDDAAENACNALDIDAEDYKPEVYEHWAVNDRLARALQAQGEIVVDIADFHIYGRTTTGQAVALDHQMQQVFIHEFKYDFDQFVESNMPEMAKRIQTQMVEIEKEKELNKDNTPTLAR